MAMQDRYDLWHARQRLDLREVTPMYRICFLLLQPSLLEDAVQRPRQGHRVVVPCVARLSRRAGEQPQPYAFAVDLQEVRDVADGRVRSGAPARRGRWRQAAGG